MGRGKNFSPEEMQYIEDKWGTISIASIAKRLGRSLNAVKLKAGRMGLTDARFLADGITLHQLSKAMGLDYKQVRNWVERYELPAKGKVFCKESRVLFIRYPDFWDWAKENQHRINFAKMEPNMLGPEPEWAKEKRRIDFLASNKSQNNDVHWTEAEDKKLLSMVNSYKYTYPEISQMLGRSAGAIKRRLHDLNVKARPVRLNNHIKWTPEETRLVVELAERGYGYHTIAEKVGKSEHGVRGKLERMRFDFKQRRLPHDEYRKLFQA